jgi:multicomponent Na+:H+ antiporter subunit A
VVVLVALIAGYVVAGLVALLTGHRLQRWVIMIGLTPFVASAALLISAAPSTLDGDVRTVSVAWIATLDVDLSARLDPMALTMGLLISGIGALVMVYAAGYVDRRDTRTTARFVAYFTLFAGAMLGLVMAADVWTLLLFWELTSVTSFLLIGLDDTSQASRAAAQRALLVTTAGGLAMLGGLACLVAATGTSSLEAIVSASALSPLGQAGLVLVLVGAFSKSAQVPFHFWLPGAMAAPTPVSAFLHSATMVKAGVFVVARLSPSFAELDWWRPLLVSVGGVTMLAGGVAALRRDDAKQSLAFGTVSQLGMLTLLFGIGDPEVAAAGVAMLVAHAVFKSALFLAVGAVEHATGTRRLSELTGIGRQLPWVATSAAVCMLSMVGVPPLMGFVAKESALATLVESPLRWSTPALFAVVAGSCLTTAYTLRLWLGMFGTKVGRPGVAVHHRPGPLLVAPVAALAACSVLAGVLAGRLQGALDDVSRSLDPESRAHVSALPHANLALLLTVVALFAGSMIGIVVTRLDRRRAEGATGGERFFQLAYDGLLDGSKQVTAIAQSGSLPFYVAVIFAVLSVVLGVSLALGPDAHWGDVVVADSLIQGAVAVLGVVMSVAVVMARRRFVSVLLLGGVGQALTVLFLLYGAPDLALTQFMVESLMIVAFLLVLRHLPPSYAAAPSWAPRALRIGLSVVVGLTVSWFALAAGGTDRPTDVTDAIEQLSLPEAGGRNVVNVTIVDFRGVDTMFEITVFGVAALGVANLVVASRRAGGEARVRRFARVGAESMIFDQTVRMIFHLTLLVSVYVTLRGHNAPGGGFAGGLIAGAAFVFRLIAGSQSSARSPRLAPAPPTLIAFGMLLAVGSGAVALLAGDEFLESSITHVDVPLIGDVKLVSTGVFDAGVYLLVVGVVILVLSNLASRTHGGGFGAEARR